MKKYIQLLPTALYPYLIVALLWLLLGSSKSEVRDYIWDKWFGNNAFVALGWILLVFFVGLLMGIVTLCVAVARKWSARELLKVNLILKCLQIPAYVCIFLCGLAFAITIITIGVTLILVVLDCMGVVMTGLIGVAAMKQAKEEGIITKSEAVQNSLLSFLFCVDVYVAIQMYRRV